MLKILKILRRASQNNSLRYKNSNAYHNYSAGTNSGTYRGPSEDSQGPIQKSIVYDLLTKLYFRSNSPCITYLLLSFTGKIKIRMF